MKRQKTLFLFAAQTESFESKVRKTEIQVTNFLIQHNLAIATADHLGPLFEQVFPDSKIASKYSSRRTKTTAILNEALAPHCRYFIAKHCKDHPYSVSTDGSNHTGIQKTNQVSIDLSDINTSKTVSNHFYNMCLTEGEHGAKAFKIFGAVETTFDQDNDVLGINVEDISIDCFYWFDKSAKRKGKLTEYFEFCDQHEKWADERFERLHGCFSNTLLEPALLFQTSAFTMFTDFNLWLQRDEPSIHLLKPTMESFGKNARRIYYQHNFQCFSNDPRNSLAKIQIHAKFPKAKTNHLHRNFDILKGYNQCLKSEGNNIVCARTQQMIQMMIFDAAFAVKSVAMLTFARFVISLFIPSMESAKKKMRAFRKMMTAGKRPSQKQLPLVQRLKHGHEHTTRAFCMSCFQNYKINAKGKFWLARFNPSSTKSHMDRIHKGNEVDIFGEEDPQSREAVKAFDTFQQRYIVQNELKIFNAINKRFIKKELEVFEKIQVEEKVNSNPIEEAKPSEKTEHSLQAIQPTRQQITIDHSMKDATHTRGLNQTNIQGFAKIIAENVSKNIARGSSRMSNTLSKIEDPVSSPGNKASHLPELLQLEKDVEMIIDGDDHRIQCKICCEFLKSSFGKPSASTDYSSLPKGLKILEKKVYESIYFFC
eukprot:gene10441-11534_t